MPAPTPEAAPLFPSFFLAGFECSTHRVRRGRRRLDMVAASGHEACAAADYARCAAAGIRATREGLRWHLAEPSPGRFDWSRELPRLWAAQAAGVHVVWDLFHYGWPDDLDVFSPAFVDRFTAFARAFAQLHQDETDQPLWVAPVNEPSFVAWAGGDVAYFNPFRRGCGAVLKRQLARAAIGASMAVRDVAPRARLCHVDPVIHTPADPARPRSHRAAAAYEAGMWEAWDMIAGRREPALGGSEALLDVVGVNYYPRNQWVYRGRRLRGPVLRPGDPLHRPLGDILTAVHARYGRPLFVAETGCEGNERPAWLAGVAREVHRARTAGVPVHGVCWYPILNHPGWEDYRHLTCGMWDYPPGPDGARAAHAPLLDEFQRWRGVFEAPPAAPAVPPGL